MHRLTLITAATIAGIILAPRSHAAELLSNGDFSGGNAGFTSSYGYSPGDLWAEGVYDVVGNPQADHALFSAFGDRTTGDGLMMVVNGSGAENALVWGEAGLSVLANTDYIFSFWLASAHPDSPARVAARINGAWQAMEAQAVSTTGAWQQFSYTWNSGSATTADVALVNRNLAYHGNDFALDDMSFAGPEVAPIPEPAAWALMIAGFGLAGAVLRARRHVSTTFAQ